MPDITLLHVILVIGFWIVIKVIAGCTDLLLAELRANRNEIAGVDRPLPRLVPYCCLARCCAGPPATPPANWSAGPVRLDARAGRVSVERAPIRLTSHEYRLLSYLMHHAGRIVSRGEIVDHLYEQDFDRDSNTIEVFVGRLRKKLGVDIIQTARGLGYIVETLRSSADAAPPRKGAR